MACFSAFGFGKTKVTMLQRYVFQKHGHLTGISLRSNHGLFSVVTLCFESVSATFSGFPWGTSRFNEAMRGQRTWRRKYWSPYSGKHQLAS